MLASSEKYKKCKLDSRRYNAPIIARNKKFHGGLIS